MYYREVTSEEETGLGYELIIYLKSGNKFWCFNGKPHREDGPAIEYQNSSRCWCLDGEELDKDWFLKQPEKIAEMQAWELFTPEELVRLKHEVV